MSLKGEIIMINKIMDRAIELERTLTGDEEPEVGINEETGMITINRYSESRGSAEWIEDFCDVIDVDLEKLRWQLGKHGIAYCL